MFNTIQHMGKHKGVGDTVEALLNLPGIKSVVKTIIPEGTDCGCNKRKEKLNEWLPYTQE